MSKAEITSPIATPEQVARELVEDELDEMMSPREFAATKKALIDRITTALEATAKERDERIAELERRLRIPFGKLPCGQCGGPHDFDTSIPSVVWNRTIRARGLSDYLCTTCIVREFVKAGEGFTATLWSEEFNGIPIEVVVNGQNAKDAAAIQEENNAFRNKIALLEARDKSAREDERERCAEIAFDSVKAVEESSVEYSALQKAATVAANVRRDVGHASN